VIDLTGLKCWRCVLKGYNTPAGDIDENNKPICVFCADGVPCPEAKRKPLDTSKLAQVSGSGGTENPPNKRTEKNARKLSSRELPESSDAVTEWNQSAEEVNERFVSGPTNSTEEKRTMPMFAKRNCLYDLCAKEFTPNGARQQYCSPEHRDADRSGATKPKSAGRKKASPKSSAPAAGVELTPKPVADEGVHTIAVHEKHVDRLLVGLPIERKVEILRAELAL
jgi:hypothetical protein